MNPHLAANERYGTTISYGIWLASYILGGLLAYLIYPYVKDQGPILSVFWMNIAATLVVFVVSSIFNNASLYDAYWSIAPVFILFFWWEMQCFDSGDTRKVLALVAVCLRVESHTRVADAYSNQSTEC